MSKDFIDEFKRTCNELLNYKPKLDFILVHPLLTSKIIEIGGDNMPIEGIKKKCPFCGEPSIEIVEMEHNKFIKYYVKCENCESTGPMANSFGDALKEWNDRSAPDAYGLVSPKLDRIKESISEIEEIMIEIEAELEDEI